MPDVKWTLEQQNAIDIRNSKTLVAAGAGSGKTAVLVERIIKKIINDNIDIDKMLIVTFTNAAASEMKERIRAKLYDEVNNNSSLQKQILYLNRASIMTIDAFCKKAIKDYFYKLDIDPNFKIADNTELELIKMESIDELLEELYESDDDNVIEILEAFSSNKSDDSLINLILYIHRFIQSSPYPLKWLYEKCEIYNTTEIDFSNTLWGKNLISYTRQVVKEIIEELQNVSDELANDVTAHNYYLTIQDDLFLLSSLIKNNYTWNDYYKAFQNLKFSSLKRAPMLDDETKEYVKSVREKMKALVEKYLRDEVFISSSVENMEDIKKIYLHAKTIYKIVSLFDEKFKEKKYERNILDFSDIEHLCLKLFEDNEDVVEDYKRKYEEILIDEYQDSNLIQESILTKITNTNLFMVGDVKQSIYKFRQARPELFMNKYSIYSLYDNSVTNHSEENKILLFKNFRSNENIIDIVNFIFKNIMTKESGEIDYNEDEFLKFGATSYNYTGEPLELHIIEKNHEEEIANIIDDDIEEKPQLEARVIAKRIEELVGNYEVYDKATNQKRKAKYSDIVILLRATKNYSDVFFNELTNRNIPTFSDTRSGYFESLEVNIIISLLKIIDNPYQDIPLVAVLRSPIFNFDMNELSKIRMYNPKSNYYEAIMSAATQGNKKAEDFIYKLSEWREKSRYFSLDDFISFLYEDTKYYYYVSLLPNGEARQNNLKLLLKKATEFAESSYKGLYSFLTFMENVKASSGDFDPPSELSENDDVVRIMSIHKSKGLEFPIVFLAGIARPFNKRDLNEKVVLHQDMGIGFDVIDINKRISYASIPKLAIKLKCEKEMKAEEMRILYVALTRAKEKLIITALTPNMKKKIDSYSSKITEYAVCAATSFADWILRVAFSTDNNWNIREWTYDDVLKINNSDNIANESISHNLDSTYSKEDYDFVNQRFSWKYKYSLSTRIPAKLSVSELKRLNNIEDLTQVTKVQNIETPTFIDDAISHRGAEYGSILHSKMERLNLKAPNIDEILIDVEDIKLKEKLEKDIQKFLDSELYQLIKASDKICKEVPFNMNILAKSVFKDENDSLDDEIMVQGIIDLYCENSDNIIMVDYKSDNISDENEFISRYKNQLMYYKKALESATNKHVSSSYIYSFKMGKTINVPI